VKQIRFNLLKLAWYMRGALTMDEVYAMPPEDRDLIGDIVKENMETTKKSGLPFF
jgi:hypothetical protein